MECGGKRSATPLWVGLRESAVAASLCRRTPNLIQNLRAKLHSINTFGITLGWPWNQHEIIGDDGAEVFAVDERIRRFAGDDHLEFFGRLGGLAKPTENKKTREDY